MTGGLSGSKRPRPFLIHVLVPPRSLSHPLPRRFRRHYLLDDRSDKVKLDQEDVAWICGRVVDNDRDTNIVAEQFDVSRRRVQQLAKEYW